LRDPTAAALPVWMDAEPLLLVFVEPKFAATLSPVPPKMTAAAWATIATDNAALPTARFRPVLAMPMPVLEEMAV